MAEVQKMKQTREREELGIKQKHIQELLEIEYKRQQAAIEKSVWDTLKAGTTTGRIQGKKANMTILDDVYGQRNQYSEAVHMIEASMQHIRRSVEMMEQLSNMRFRSPWHPKRWIAWFQRRSRLWWYFFVTSPILFLVLWELGSFAYDKGGFAGLAAATYGVGLVVFFTADALGYIKRQKKR